MSLVLLLSAALAVVGLEDQNVDSSLDSEAVDDASPPPILPIDVMLRGDANSDGIVNIADSIGIVSYLFTTGHQPLCLDAADADDDGAVGTQDAITILTALFLNSSVLLGVCAPDPTEDVLACDSSSCMSDGGGGAICSLVFVGATDLVLTSAGHATLTLRADRNAGPFGPALPLGGARLAVWYIYNGAWRWLAWVSTGGDGTALLRLRGSTLVRGARRTYLVWFPGDSLSCEASQVSRLIVR